MKKTATLLLLLVFTVTLFANPVEPEKALEAARKFWKARKGNDSAAGLKRFQTAEISRAADRNGGARTETPQYYLFTAEDENGFVIVSGEDRLAPIVAYSTVSSVTVSEMPNALVEWLGEYSAYVDDIRDGIAEPRSVSRDTGTRIEPMLETSWNQGSPYNSMCPDINGQKPPTGCTATAMAQIMKFHEWPAKATKNITWTSNITGSDEYVNLTSHSYKWSDMLDHYRSGYTQAQANAVAQLMVDVGKAINSSYAMAGTGSNEIFVSEALVNVFDYSPDAVVQRRSETTEEEFVALIRENLEARQPVLFTGQGQSFSSGHAFVCDGIDENNLLHIDWGWDGAYNGFFDMTFMQPEGVGTGGGSGRYNVAQAIVANIRPRSTGEANRNGTPTLYYTAIYDPADTTQNPVEIDEYVTTVSNGMVNFKIATFFLNWSHSLVNAKLALALETFPGEYEYDEITGASLSLKFNDSGGYYLTFEYDVSGTAKGTYNIKLCYKNANGTYTEMPGDNNLQMIIGDNEVKLCKAVPQVELANMEFLVTPMYKGDKLAFTAEFVNRNKNNSLILVVPVLNTQLADGSYSSRLLTNYGALIDVYDNRNIYAEFNTNEIFPTSGNYYISFAFNVRNYYIDHDMAVDKMHLVDIQGRSESISITEIPDGAVPAITELSADNAEPGKKLIINGTIKNIANTNDAYSGTLGVFIRNSSTGKEFLLKSFTVENLAKGNSADFSCSTTGFFPTLEPGKYTAFVRERKNGWAAVKHSSATCKFSILDNDTPLLYAADKMNINDGAVVVQGNSFNATARLSAMNGDFDGYVKVSVYSGLITVITSDYIPVSVKYGNVVDVTMPCTSKASTKLGLYEMNIICYDSNKTRIGYVSNNNFAFPKNGEFWVGDATAVEPVGEAGITVFAKGGQIVVNGAAEGSVVAVYSADGREVYCGTDMAVVAGNGLYIVTVTTPGGSVKRVKVAAGN